MASDLNAIRDAMLAAQTQNVAYPKEPSQTVTVDRNATIRLGASPADAPSLSKVQHGTFAAVLQNTRLERDQSTARTKLPTNTRYFDEPGAEGWMYSFVTELGDTFELFASFNGRDYEVFLVSPEIETKYNAHSAHLFRDGRLCLSTNSGTQPSLEEAYSKSVLWANGMSFHMRGEIFPWSINNL